MPWSEFSEFSFGHGVVREAENLLAAAGLTLTAAPELPSLLKENNVGYDANLVTVDLMLFLQFKRSFYVSRLHTRGSCGWTQGAPHCSWAYWSSPHYRFAVDTDSKQLSIMRSYESQVDQGTLHGLALYIAPAFYEQDDWNAVYAAGQILDYSAGVEPSVFDGLLGGDHAYSYYEDLSASVVLSEPRTGTIVSAGAAIRNYLRVRVDVPDRPTVNLADLVAWARQAAASTGLALPDPNADGPQSVRFLNDVAALLGGAFVLLGRDTASALG